MRLDITPAAKADIREIYLFSRRQWGAAKARLYAEELRRRLHLLARRGISGTAADDVAPNLRGLVAGSHVIWFRVEDDHLRVIRVLHQSRDAGRWVG